MSHAKVVSFENPDGLRLFGTLHYTDAPNPDRPAVVLLSAGVKTRVGPGRLYVPLTETLTNLGYTVLRFDFYGLGDSEGELAERLLLDVYSHIQLGRYVGDALSALDWLRSTYGFQNFVLGGLCGGAITALLTAQRRPDVVGLLSLGMTVRIDSDVATASKYLTRVELDERRSGYWRRLAQPRSWLRFLTLQSDYGVIWRSLRRLFLPETRPAAAPPSAVLQAGNTNPLFAAAFFDFLRRGGRVLMLFSGKDRLHAEYEEKFAQPFAGRLAEYDRQIEHYLVPEANHVLAWPQWRNEMIAVSERWIKGLPHEVAAEFA
jgi:pimeloyl-ACP methyl ester carboxylesterase